MGAFPISSAEDVDCAVTRAQQAGLAWAARTAAERANALRQLRDSLGADADNLAAVVSQEIGKPLQDALSADVLALILSLEWLAKQSPKLLRPRPIHGERGAHLEAMPYGLVGVIGTWNYPLLLDGCAIAWALAAGNSVVWKPSELASASASALLPHFERAGLPIVMVTGDGATGRDLCRTAIDKLIFTGSVATGRAILGELAKHGTPSVMELSGNDALIVCTDADIEEAAKAAVWARCCNAGQSCVSPQRVFVAREIYEPFLAACAKSMNALRPGVDYGPLRTNVFRTRVQDLVCDAISREARLVAGGRPLEEAGFAGGCYYLPTLLADCQTDMPVMQQDFFGPVLCVCAVANEEDAIAAANATEMGLGASVWTRNLIQGRAIASRLRAGVVTVNTETLLTGANPALPFGGTGASGWGRQRGAAGLEEFVQWKMVQWRRSGGARRHIFPYKTDTLPLLRAVIALKTAPNPKAKLQAVRQLITAARHWNSKV